MIELEEDGLKLLQFTDWHSIRDEYFFIAPKSFFNDLIPRADMLRHRAARQEQRQKERLEKMVAELPAEPMADDAALSADVHGLRVMGRFGIENIAYPRAFPILFNSCPPKEL